MLEMLGDEEHEPTVDGRVTVRAHSVGDALRNPLKEYVSRIE
jgi:hypothetical protein